MFTYKDPGNIQHNRPKDSSPLFLLFFLCFFILQISSCSQKSIKKVEGDQGQVCPEHQQSYFESESHSCTLGKNEVIKIACTFGCQEKNKLAITEVAEKFQFKVVFLDLETLNRPQDVDAVLLEGGADIIPQLYQDKLQNKDKSPQILKTLNPGMNEKDQKQWKKKDLFEMGFLKNFFENKKYQDVPLLGICRGMQMLGVAQGIPMYIDLKENLNIEPPKRIVHPINISCQQMKRPSLIRSLFNNKNRFDAWENHHQGIHFDYFNKNKEKFPHLQVTASSHDNRIIEAIERTDRAVLGVQFHPENSESGVKGNIFSWLLNSACKKKKLMRQ